MKQAITAEPKILEIGINDLYKKSIQLSKKIIDFVGRERLSLTPITIVPIVRSGLFVSQILSYQLDLRPKISCIDPKWIGKSYKNCTPKERYKLDNFIKTDSLTLQGETVVVIDSVHITGKSMETVVNHISKCNPLKVYTASIFCFEHDSIKKPNIYLEKFEEKSDDMWIKFPWER